MLRVVLGEMLEPAFPVGETGSQIVALLIGNQGQRGTGKTAASSLRVWGSMGTGMGGSARCSACDGIPSRQTTGSSGTRLEMAAGC